MFGLYLVQTELCLLSLLLLIRMLRVKVGTDIIIY
uniref:Uncharacterized protein n=1 Tax=Siphoviridae sp. ct5op20 TaxID=2826295 RepID=A0A8S5NQ60_9CAUD|nr:MAG TPA: hypothetical protein [Siphoviridae sp. ct5op20]